MRFKLLYLEVSHERPFGVMEYNAGLIDLERRGAVAHVVVDLDGFIRWASTNYGWLEGFCLRTWSPELNFKKYYYYSLIHRGLRRGIC